MCLLLSAVLSFSQTPTVKDTIYTIDEHRYAGTVTKIVADDYVLFITEDSISHRVSYTSISELKLAHADKLKTLTVKEPTRADSLPPSLWSGINLPDQIVRKRRTGIALSVTGAALIFAGSIMIGVNPGNISSQSGSGYAEAHFGGVAALGIVFDIAGLPMMITGIIKSVKSKNMAERWLLDKRRQDTPVTKY